MWRGETDVRRATGDSGAALVEFAFVLPILAMFLFGTVSAGMAWNTNLAMAQGARMGGRYGATLPTRNYTSLDDFLDAIETQVVGSSEGSIDTTAAGRIVCVAYVHPNGSTTLDQTRRRYESGTNVTRANSTCFTDGQGSDDVRIQVMSERTTKLEAGIWSRTVTLHQQLVFRYEVSNGL
jgi:Flp pilus assembly protein TadG